MEVPKAQRGKKKKKIDIAVLKNMVLRPDVVEEADTTSPDP